MVFFIGVVLFVLRRDLIGCNVRLFLTSWGNKACEDLLSMPWRDEVGLSFCDVVLVLVKGFTPLCLTWAVLLGDRLVVTSLWLPPEV